MGTLGGVAGTILVCWYWYTAVTAVQYMCHVWSIYACKFVNQNRFTGLRGQLGAIEGLQIW